MSAYTQTMGYTCPVKDRRSGKDRRRFIDPRYRNPAYPQFIDRRKDERRKPVYDEVPHFVKEHPVRRWIIIVSILVAAFLMYIFFFTNLIVSRQGLEKPHQTGTIVLGANDAFPNSGQWSVVGEQGAVAGQVDPPEAGYLTVLVGPAHPTVLL